MARVLQMPARPEGCPVPTVVDRFGWIHTAESYFRSRVSDYRKAQLAAFVGNLETARLMFRRCPDLVTAERVNLPEPFFTAFREENAEEPFASDGLDTDEVLDPHFDQRVIEYAVEAVLRVTPEEDRDQMRSYLQALIASGAPAARPAAG